MPRFTGTIFEILSAPVSGTLPSFTVAPIVFIRNSSTNRYLSVDRTSETTTGFDVIASDVFSDDPPYTVDIGIITTEVTAAGAGVATAVSYPYYCSYQDVKEVLLEFDRAFAEGQHLDTDVVQRTISRSASRINATLAANRYTTPGANSIKQVITNSLTASENVVTLNQVEDGTKFAAGDTVRIHGTTGSTYADEFSEVAAVSGDLVDVLYLVNSYDALSTVEKVNVGMQALRHINAQGAALLALGGLTVGVSSGENTKTVELTTEFQRGLDDIADGRIVLEGLTRRAPIETYIRKNSATLHNDGDSHFVAGTRF